MLASRPQLLFSDSHPWSWTQKLRRFSQRARRLGPDGLLAPQGRFKGGILNFVCCTTILTS